MLLPTGIFRQKAQHSLVLIALALSLSACDYYAQPPNCFDYFEAGDTSGYELLEGGLARHLQSQTVWYRCPAGTSFAQGQCQGTMLSVSWSEAAAFAEEFSEKSGYRWQLPSTSELSSIMQTSCRNPAVNPNVFPMVAVDNHWTRDSALINSNRKCMGYTYQGQISCRALPDSEHPFMLLMQP
jgi:hypothetical protein